ncbi:Tenascin-X [Phytophthora citrophthora]|uniref:Tenascin-X n=1 Tax=Phytophthora citrophthora TaxID=4793 RepID=A0AAD9GA54_9STRA|nr:Tenascin-X [Phytophthora citrophthora]
MVVLVWLALCCLLVTIEGACPSKCNRHGTCGSDNTCTCFPGYTGYDCNSRSCPKGTPWVDFATAQDSVRFVPQECSNRGRCNRNKGRCECDVGFAGTACERLQLCRTNCNGHGKCMSMRAMAATKNDYNLFYSAVYDTPWDADRIYGCVCDFGYSGADCSLRRCPYGDDPISTNQVDEMQAVSCLCNGCTGTFTLSFRGETTRPLDGSVDTAATLKIALEELQTIRGVSVALNGGTTLCDSDGVSALITFTYEHGDVPALVVTSSLSGGTSSFTVQTDGARAAYGPTPPLTVRGTKEWLECSGRGACNTLLGLCSCATGFGPSDGLGGSGNILDCGYYSGSGLTTCAGRALLRCRSSSALISLDVIMPRNLWFGDALLQPWTMSGCLCDDGFGGYDCSQPQCPTGRAWVEEASTDNVAHTSVVPCSNAVRTLYSLLISDVLAANTTIQGNGAICNNRGTCRTLRELAALTPTTSFTAAGFVYGSDPNALSTWDTDMAQGCYCDKVPLDRGKSVRYSGYSCSKIPCPSGDDPWTVNQVDEVQAVTCSADGGVFALSFRGETTLPIQFSASPAAVKSALERLLTITSVGITFSSGISACSSAGNAGDLPLLSVYSTALTHSSTSVAANVLPITQGTKEDTVCNNRGRCDEDTGNCICSQNHASSNAIGGIGTFGDCGAVDAFMTHGEL